MESACVGRLLLQSRQTAGAAAAADLARTSARKKGRKRRRTITYAGVKFRIPAGKRKTICVIQAVGSWSQPSRRRGSPRPAPGRGGSRSSPA